MRHAPLCLLAFLALAAPAALAQSPAPPAAPAAAAGKPSLLPSSAASYGEYQGEVSKVTTRTFSNAQDVDGALNTLGARNPDQLSSGWISYSALIASRNEQFAHAVRDIDGFYGRERVMSGMRNDVGYARTLEGGEKALQTALAVNARDTSRISSASSYVRDQSRKLMDIGWGKTKLKNSSGVAQSLEANSRITRPVTDAAQKLFSTGDLDLVLSSAANAPSSSVWDKVSVFAASAPAAALSTVIPAQAAPAPTMQIEPSRIGTANRIVTLAAFHVLGAETTHADAMRAAMRDTTTQDCVSDAQAQLRACVSAASTPAEQSFCLAQHALGDTSQNATRSVGVCFARVAR
jgi:hypothetical protein